MEVNKIVAGVCATLLVFLGLNFFAELIYYPGEDEELAYALAVEDSGGGKEEESVDLAAVFGAADAAAGESVFKKCAACHSLAEGENKVGPTLYGVVTRPIGSVAGFDYSGALPEDEVWSPENLFAFLEAPKSWAKGTSMSFNGLKKPEDRADVIAYLNEDDGTPVELVAAPAKTADEGDAAEGDKAAAEGQKEDNAASDEAKPEDGESGDAAAEEAKPEGDDAAAEEAGPKSGEAASEEGKPEDEDAAAEEAKPEEANPEDGEAGSDEEAPAEESKADDGAGKDAAAAGGSEAGSVAPELAAAFAAADVGAGEKVFRKCKACHKLEEGENGVGPSLYGVVGRKIRSIEGYSYSDALPADKTWTPANLSAFLAKPRDWAPGTKMSFAGLGDIQDRADVIAYLNEADGSPEPLPTE